MWKFKPFMHKEPVGLEGRCIDVGNLKISVQNAVAEGGFSCVYLARDNLNASKQYALKHMICNDEESMELVMKEINVMKSLKGHPNVVTLHAHTILDMGRRKEALLVMEFCEKSLVNVLEARAGGHFEEKQVLSIFRDACNAIFAMHSQFPPIAHRDLKPENLLLGSDGLWKLCDFGSTTTNHKRFEKPEEMGIEEDNIRKHTTPAYRAPEMWDLLRRDVISEKVDIWALGCLLFRICYFKNAFDGESKLQILNGNYRIPELPKYNVSVVELIRDMLQASPEDRPDITQVWFRVNELLPVNLQKSLPNSPPESTGVHDGFSKTTNRSPPMPQTTPPPPPSSGANRSPPMPQRSPPPPSLGVGGGGGQLGAFWSTQHAKESVVEDEDRPRFDDEPSHGTLKQDRIHPEKHTLTQTTTVSKEENVQTRVTRSNFHSKLHGHGGGTSKDFEISFSQNEREHGLERPKALKTESTSIFQDDAFNSFIADFDSSKLNSTSNNKLEKEEALEAEIERLKEQLKQVNSEKAEITSKFEKLSAICRSQRQEIQELKQAVAARKSPDRYQVSPQSSGTLGEKSEWATPSPEPKLWHAFADDPKQPLSKGSSPQSVRTRTSQQKKQNSPSSSDFNSWSFGTDNFSAVPVSCSPPISEGSGSQRLNGQKIVESQPTSQPAGWAGF